MGGWVVSDVQYLLSVDKATLVSTTRPSGDMHCRKHVHSVMVLRKLIPGNITRFKENQHLSRHQDVFEE